MKNITITIFKKTGIPILLLILSQFNLYAQNAASPDPVFITGSGTNNHIYTLGVQSDHKIIIGGSFTSYDGSTVRNHIARLNPDGSLDAGFNVGSGTNFGVIYANAIQSDGKIIIGGSFSSYNGIAITNIARLNANGTLDASFNPGSGTDNTIFEVALQSDGKLIIGGSFTTYNGTASNNIARLNTDGSMDTSFHVGTGVSGLNLSTIAIQNDNKVIIGGDITAYNGISVNNIARLNTDGSLDTSFHIGTGIAGGVYSTRIQSDGKIMIGGVFSSYNGTSIKNLARLNTDGSLDNSFSPGTGSNERYFAITVQSDGKILVGGAFTIYNGIPQNFISRLNPDGSLDPTFDIGTGTDNSVEAIAVQSDGTILVVGAFSTYQNAVHNNIVGLQGARPRYYNTIEGTIFTDGNADCNFQTTENRLSPVIVKALPGPYYGASDITGYYKLNVDSGSVVYTLTQNYTSINSKFLINQCASSQNVSLTGIAKDTCCFNFADSVKQCYLLDVNVQKTRARQCIRNLTYVNYTNYGSSSASGVIVKVEYPAHIIPVASVPMWTSVQGSVVTYNIGTIPAGQNNQIIITDSVSCINGIGDQTECIKATISPSSNCINDNPAWDKSSMMVTGTCQGGNAHFVITNDGTGDMGGSLPYRVYQNDTLIFSGTYLLKSGESFTVDYPAQGQSIRLEADQHPLHPGKSHPRATVTNCGTPLAGTTATNLVTTAPLDDLDEATAMTCPLITNSHDPNEKQAIPSGIGAAHNIAPGEELEYLISFQNTGNDTAYVVTIVDTLDAGLDATSFTQSASSHPYTFQITGKGQAVLTFKFKNINLPDSSTNLLASSGLVSFRITVPSGSSIGTVIKNKAYIYFDYNEPVITNETMHTVNNNVASNTSLGSLVQVGAVVTGLSGKKFNQSTKIYPNPTAGMITVEIPETGSSSELRILSSVGDLRKSVPLSGSVQKVSLEGLNQGLYLYEIWQDGERKTGGKLQVWF